MPSDDSRHRRRRLRGQPSGRPAGRATAPTSSRGIGPAARRRAQRRATRWEPVDLLDRGRGRRRDRRGSRPPAVYHCAGAAHVGRVWDSTESTFATNVRGTHHLLQALERAGDRRRAC